MVLHRFKSLPSPLIRVSRHLELPFTSKHRKGDILINGDFPYKSKCLLQKHNIYLFFRSQVLLLIACPIGKVEMEKLFERLKKTPKDSVWDMTVYWDLPTGSPGTAGWMRWHYSKMDREETAYIGWGDKDYMCSRGEGTRITCFDQNWKFLW